MFDTGWGAAVGVRQQTLQTRTPASFTKVQCSHCHETLGGGGGGPSDSASNTGSSAPFFCGSDSLSLSESASLDGMDGGDGVRYLLRREARDRTLIAGDAARDPTRDVTRDAARLSAAESEQVKKPYDLFTSN